MRFTVAPCWQTLRVAVQREAEPRSSEQGKDLCGDASWTPSPKPATLLPPLFTGLAESQHLGGKPPNPGQQPPTLSLECRLQEDITVCFLGLPLGRLPLFRFCTSFSCSLKTISNQSHILFLRLSWNPMVSNPPR